MEDILVCHRSNTKLGYTRRDKSDQVLGVLFWVNTQGQGDKLTNKPYNAISRHTLSPCRINFILLSFHDSKWKMDTSTDYFSKWGLD